MPDSNPVVERFPAADRPDFGYSLSPQCECRGNLLIQLMNINANRWQAQRPKNAF
jgi:hypothetical protein